MYTSFRTEQEWDDHVNEAAEDGYEQLEQKIHFVKSQDMEYLESNEEARYNVDETSSKIYIMTLWARDNISTFASRRQMWIAILT